MPDPEIAEKRGEAEVAIKSRRLMKTLSDSSFRLELFPDGDIASFTREMVAEIPSRPDIFIFRSLEAEPSAYRSGQYTAVFFDLRFIEGVHRLTYCGLFADVPVPICAEAVLGLPVDRKDVPAFQAKAFAMRALIERLLTYGFAHEALLLSQTLSTQFGERYRSRFIRGDQVRRSSQISKAQLAFLLLHELGHHLWNTNSDAITDSKRKAHEAVAALEDTDVALAVKRMYENSIAVDIDETSAAEYFTNAVKTLRGSASLVEVTCDVFALDYLFAKMAILNIPLKEIVLAVSLMRLAMATMGSISLSANLYAGRNPRQPSQFEQFGRTIVMQDICFWKGVAEADRAMASRIESETETMRAITETSSAYFNRAAGPVLNLLTSVDVVGLRRTAQQLYQNGLSDSEALNMAVELFDLPKEQCSGELLVV